MEKHPTSAAGVDGAVAASSAAAAAAAASASAPDKYAATDMDYIDEDPDEQIEFTLSPSDSYGVEVHEAATSAIEDMPLPNLLLSATSAKFIASRRLHVCRVAILQRASRRLCRVAILALTKRAEYSAELGP